MAVAPAKEDEKRIEEAQKLAKSDPSKAETIYKDILTKDPGSTDTALRNFEKALVGLGELFRDQRRANDLADLIHQTRSALSSFARSKTAKLGMPSARDKRRAHSDVI
jgi:26S proteasome regulatory subunit N6